MSFVTAIRDYIELLNTLYDSTAGHINSQVIVQETLIYLFTSIKYLFFYFITFQWFRDFSYLPILAPEIYSSLLKETFFLENPVSHFLSFIEPQSYENNKLLIGFLNSFFLSLPISCVHLIWLRRLLIQGIPAGIASGFGTVLGQWWFTTSVLFGLRSFLIPRAILQPLIYVIGVFLIVKVIHDMAHERSFRIIKVKDKRKLIEIFLLNFSLSASQQSCIFQYFGNLTFGPEPTALESFSSTTEMESFLIHGSYSLGLLLGGFFFTALFGWFFIRLGVFVRTVFKIQLSKWMHRSNFVLLSFTIALTFSSIPYYGLDYLITRPLGYVSQDPTLEKTLFSPNTWKEWLFLKEDDSDANFFINSDLNPFDRGYYLQRRQPSFATQPQSFEDLNYEGEFAWTQKDNRPANIYELDRSRKLVKKLISKNKKEGPFSAPTEIENQSFKKDKEKQLSDTDRRSVKGTNSQLSDLETDEESEEDLGELEFDVEDFGGEGSENNKRESLLFLKELANLTDQSFLDFFIKDDPKIPNLRLERSIKEKYYSNPVYKFLLKIDIDSFLLRQPARMKLSSVQEKQLYKNRLMLANYYDSLRNYEQLSDTDQFKDTLSRSYADRVFNHQFKGTLRVVRRLFSVTLDPKEEQKRIERLKMPPAGTDSKNQRLDRVLKFDKPLYNSNLNNTEKMPKFFHEELYEELYSGDDENIENPFLEITDSVPFYAGWDQQTRKLVLTNRLLPRTFAGYTITPDKDYIELLTKNRQTLNKKERIDFSAWPLPESFVRNQKQNPKSQSKIPYNVLFESVDDPKNKSMDETFKNIDLTPENDWKIETYPPILNKVFNSLEEIVPPNRGGYIWPGNSTLKFNIKKISIPSKTQKADRRS